MRNSKLFYLGVLWLSVSLSFCLPAMAATLTVNTLTAAIDATDGACSFYEAIDAINNNSAGSVADCGAATDSANTIQLPAGTINLTTAISLSNKNVQVLGATSSASGSVLMMGSGMSGFLWSIDGNDDLTLQNLTLDTQANSAQGFIFVLSVAANPILRLSNVIMQNGVNSSNSSQSALATMTNSVLQVFMQNTQIINNRRGITNSGGTISINSSAISNNGLGVSVANGGSITVTGSRLLNNTASTDGSALYVGDGSLSVNNSCIVGNAGVSVFDDPLSVGTISVDNNWWGRSDGPAPTGSGDQISASISVGASLTTAPAGCPTLTFSCDAVTGITSAECVNLRALYVASNGEAWTNSGGWFDSNDACSWYGVTCSSGFVNSLQLNSNGLSGTLPNDLSAFTNLVNFDLSNNMLSGSLNALTTLDVVETISLSSNFFGGSIPDLSGLPDLTDLDLSNNQFTGTVSWLNNVGSLMGLALDYNALDLSDTASIINTLNPSAALTQTLPVANLKVVETTLNSITLNWSPIAYDKDAGAYRIEFATSATGTYTQVGQTADKTVSQFVVTGLAENTTYFFRVRTFTAAHGEQKNALLSDPSAVVSATTTGASAANATADPVSDTPLAFGDIALGTRSSAITVQVLSVGTEAFSLASNVSGTNPNDFQVTVTPFAYTNPATGTVTGESYDVNVVCNPTALGMRTAILNLTTTPDAGSFAYPLSCNAIESLNDAPTAISLSNNSINADVASAIVGTLSTADPNVSDSHTYTIPFSDSPAFAINASNLITTSSLSAGSYNVTIRSTDSGNLFVEQTFTILVNQANQAPTAISLSNNTVATSPQASTGTPIGQFSTTDVDVGDSHVYSLDEDASGLFQIQGNNLIVAVGQVLNTAGDYLIAVRSTDSAGLFIVQEFTITAIVANNAPTAIALSNNTVSTSPVASTGTPIGQFSTTDVDVGDSHVYSIDRDASGLFQIQGNNLIVAVGQVLNTAGDYLIAVRSTDSAGLFIVQEFTITAIVANNAPTAITLSNNTVSTSPTASIGTPIGQFSTTDIDVGDSHVYSIDRDASGLFQIQGNNLIVAVGQVLNTAGDYLIAVRSTDSAGLFIVQEFTITAIVANNAPTAIALSNNTVATSPAASIGTPIGQFSTTDIDVGDTHRYSLVSDASGLFQIQGNNLIVAVGQVLNTVGDYPLVIRSTDSAGLFVEQEFIITAITTNNAPTAINLSNNMVTTDTQASTGTAIGQFSTVDADVGDTHRYSLVGDASGLFQIQGSNLIIRVGRVLSVEGNYPITVRSTDSGGLFIERIFTISAITPETAPTAIALSNTEVATSTRASTGTVIGQLSTTDINLDDTHTYTLVSDASGLFQIRGSSLIVGIGQILDTEGEYPIIIRSTDSSNLFVEQAFTILTVTGDRAPSAILLSNTHIETSTEASTGTIVGQLSTIDANTDDTHSYSLVSDASGLFQIQADQLIVSVGQILSDEAEYLITIRSTDSTNLSVEQDFIITVSADAQAPLEIVLSSNIVLIDDEPNAGTVIGQFSTIDPTPEDSHEYSLLDDANGVFTLQNDSLQVVAGVLLDTEGTRQISVRSTDSTGLFIDQEFTIILREPALVTTLSGEASTATASGAELSIDAPQAVTLTSFITPSIDDMGLSVTPFIILTWQSEEESLPPISIRFQLASTTLQIQNEFVLYQGKLLNLEGDFNIALGYDSATGSREAETIIQLSVLSNRAPSNLMLSANEVAEKAARGTLIGEFQAQDPDQEDSFWYGLTDDADGRFYIAGNALLVNNGFLLDHDDQDSHEISVRAFDSFGEFTEQEFQVDVLASNNAQKMQRLLLNKRQVKEGAPVGTIIGRFSIVGPSSADYRYELLDGSNGAFAVVNDLLLVADGQLLDYESQDEHEISVQVTDLDTDEQLSADFTISVQNQPDVAGEFKLLAQGQQTPKLQLKWAADSTHVGEQAQIFVLLTNPDFSAVYMLTPEGWRVWDTVISHLVSATQVNLTARNTVLLSVEAGLEDISFLSTGQLFFAYQLDNGELLYQTTGMPVIELDLEAEEVDEADD